MEKNKLLMYTVLALTFICTGCRNNLIEKGNACLNLGDYKMAEYFFEKVLLVNPAHFEARLGYGKALLQHVIDIPQDTSVWKTALLNLEAAHTINPVSDIGMLISDAWFERAHICLSHSDTLGAFSALLRSIELNNRNVVALNTIGILYYKQGDSDKAETLFRKNIGIDSTNALSHFNLGMVMWSKKEYQKARENWLEATKLSPDDNDMVYWLALSEKTLQEKHE
jgi:tetratricopeptide (TPR) repeat protein